MYLKALEIQGFKSFPDKTRLTFEKDITAIVGPNGSGKSNIADALLWVMGEQRTKILRSSKMGEVIFGGTEKRSPLGYAQVSLILDNSARIIDSDSSEIMLTRRFYKSGESEYSINRESCRLKDIHTLLMNTGLGRDGYSVIGQGRIAEIVSTKSTDRREVFEEAAGISLFRYRKEAAEKDLEKTEENLVRINDKIEELEVQVGPLKKQSETAKKYLALRDELKGKEISLWMETLDKLKAQSQAVELEYNQMSDALTAAKDRLENIYRSSDSLSERMHEKDIDTENERDKQSAKESEKAAVESEIAVINANITANNENRTRILAEIQDRDRRVAEVSDAIKTAENSIFQLESSEKASRDNWNSITNSIEGVKLKISGRNEKVSELSEKATKLAVDLRSIDARITMLSEMEKDYEGYNKAVKTIMREAQRGTLKGIHGPVTNLIRTDEEYATAIETALGGATQNIVVDDQRTASAAIDMLKRTDSGRATFLPITTYTGRVMKNAPVNDPGFIGVAYDLISFDPRFDGIFAHLLGSTVVVETKNDAIRISDKFGNRLRIVTLDGQMMNADGSMTGGSLARHVGILSRANELERLKKDKISYEQREKRCSEELAMAKTSLARINEDLEGLIAQQSAINAEIAATTAELSAVRKSLTQLKALHISLTSDSAERMKLADECEAKEKELLSQLEEKKKQCSDISAEIDKIKAKIAEISSSKMELEAKRSRNDKEAQSCSGEIIELERSVARLEQKKTAAENEERQIYDKLWESYQLSHSSASQLRQPVENAAALSREINSLKREISALGTPNLGAIEEFERVNARYTFLTDQRSDVEKSKREVLEIIKNITDEMKTLFVEKFNAINECFKTTFLELFGGGKANLILEDPENVLDCGIEIKVQPPGKAVSTISLLSGGEKAFVAIALYFAILKVRPTPFCVMDEIEAALDEANVMRYAQYMRRIADNTQFIVITHRRGTMEEADVLYGVTMQEKGVSSVLSLDLETARKTAEA